MRLSWVRVMKPVEELLLLLDVAAPVPVPPPAPPDPAPLPLPLLEPVPLAPLLDPALT
jgi:hypothetical protein